MSDNRDNSKKDTDPELDDLLDSALQDMTKKPEQALEKSDGDAPPNMWSKEFIKEAAAQFESNMAAILGSFSGVPEEQISQDQIAQTFSKMAEAAAQVLKPAQEEAVTEPPASDPATQEKINEVSEAITRTLQNLNTDTESLQTPFSENDLANMFANFNTGEGGQASEALTRTLQNLNTDAESLQTPFSENDLANMFANFNMGEGGQENNMFLPFMQGMMQSLLSKEVLYPSLKDLVDRYPTWLADNKGKLEQSEYERFEKQQKLMEQVCSELESEQDPDPEDVKRKRFEVVLSLMQKIQDLGQPPTELVGDIGSTTQGYFPPPEQDAQCSIM